MAEILLFHRALRLTAGVRVLAVRLRAAGHVVHLPDLYEGRSFTRLKDGVGHAEAIGFRQIIERGERAAEGLPAGLVYAGMLLGVMPAQALPQTRPCAESALLLHSSVPLAEFGGKWPAGVARLLNGIIAAGGTTAFREPFDAAGITTTFIRPKGCLLSQTEFSSQ